MTESLSCPTCAGPLKEVNEATFRCGLDHRFTAFGLAFSTNLVALPALWLAVRALETESVALHTIARQGGLDDELREQRRAAADETAAAARTLREHANRAQQRLDALHITPSTM